MGFQQTKCMCDLPPTLHLDAIAAEGRALLRVSRDTTDASLTPLQAILTHAQDLCAILVLCTTEAKADSNNEANRGGGDSAMIEYALDVLVDPAVWMCVGAVEEKDALSALQPCGIALCLC
jgi:hypothetical protein